MTPPREERHQSAAVIRSSDLGFPPEVAESGLELLHGDAFKKGTTQIAPPPPALADAEGKFSPRSVRRDPTLVHGPPSPPAPPGRTLEHRQISEPPAPPHPDRRPRRAAAIPRAVRVRDGAADRAQGPPPPAHAGAPPRAQRPPPLAEGRRRAPRADSHAHQGKLPSPPSPCRQRPPRSARARSSESWEKRSRRRRCQPGFARRRRGGEVGGGTRTWRR